MLDDELDHRPHFRFRRRERACPELLELLPPVRREIAVEIEAMLRLLDAQREAVPRLDGAFRNDAVVRAAGLDRIAADHELRLLRMRLPQAVRIGDAHLQNASVTVDIL